MKKTLLILFSFLAVSLAINAQTFELTWEGETLGNELVINADPSAIEIAFDPIFTSFAADSLDIKVRRTNISTLPGSSNYFCWTGCYASFVDESPDPFRIAGGESTNIFIAHYEINGEIGVSTVEYKFFNVNDESQNVTVTVHYTTSVPSEDPFEFTLNGEVLGDVVEIIEEPTVAEMLFDPLVTNTTGSSMDIKVRRTNVDVLAGTINYFCWGACYGASTDVSSEFITLGPGETTNLLDFSGHYEPTGIEGTSTVEYTFFNMADESQSTTITVRYSTPNAISEDIANGVRFENIYPNPATDYVNINYTLVSGVKEGSVRISNLLGAVVSETPIDINSNTVRMDVSNLEGGIYFYSVVLNGEILHSKKLIIR